MSAIADPVDNPIPITRNTNYLYTLPATIGLTSITATGTDFTVSTLGLGLAATLQIKYTAAVAGGPEYHTVDLTATFDDGSTAAQTLNFQVYGDATVIPNITNPSSMSVATGQLVQIATTQNPIGTRSIGIENAPNWLSVDANGFATGTAPSTGSTNLIKLTLTMGVITFKRYLVLVVGDGGAGGGGLPITPPAGGGAFFDGDYSQPVIAGPIEYEIPFKVDPKPYAYSVLYWQFDQGHVEPSIGDPGPFGGYYVGVSAIKPIGGGVIQFRREFAIVPDTRNEYESFVYGFYFTFFTLGLPNICSEEVPLTVNSRIQFDYFRTDDPNSIYLPGKPTFAQTCLGLISLNGADALTNMQPGVEILAEDATLKIWKPGIYERKQRFVKWLRGYNIVS